MVGGPISQGFADRIGADGYARNASQAVKLAGKFNLRFEQWLKTK